MLAVDRIRFVPVQTAFRAFMLDLGEVRHLRQSIDARPGIALLSGVIGL